jgi:hypothetical protein
VLDDLTHVNRSVVDRALALNLVGDQFVFLVEEKDPELFSVLVGLRGGEICDYFRSRREERALRDFRARQPGRGRADELQFGGNGFADARNLFQARVRRVENLAKEPKRAMSRLARSFVSRRGMARKSTSSRSS